MRWKGGGTRRATSPSVALETSRWEVCFIVPRFCIVVVVVRNVVATVNRALLIIFFLKDISQIDINLNFSYVLFFLKKEKKEFRRSAVRRATITRSRGRFSCHAWQEEPRGSIISYKNYLSVTLFICHYLRNSLQSYHHIVHFLELKKQQRLLGK